MNIGKFRKNLKKINKFDDWSDDQEVKLTRIEKDILLEYIRKLYKSVLDENIEEDQDELQKPVKSNKKSDDKSRPKANSVAQQKKTGEVKSEPEIPVVRKEIIEEKKSAVKLEEVKSIPVEDQIEPVIETPAEKVVAMAVSDKFMSIFNETKSHELSEKLSMMPVSDLRKVFGLNEKIFTINELFDGDGKVFDSAITELNNLSSFTEARDYIILNLTSRFKWDTELKLKKAEHFVKTIRRRYLN
ncbi:MAG: hypothetical protein IPH57_14285 [Saprospiraceae bacterium]|nr:hypothetical protein [Saprospiraceae bacterium]